MRVSNNQIIGSSVQALQQQGADALKYQKQISSGNRFLKASEGPVELARGIAIEFQQKRREMLKSNQNIVQMNMDVGYVQLDTMSSLMFNLKEMASRAAFPGFDAASLDALYQEALVVYNSLEDSAKGTDASGRSFIALAEPPDVEVDSGVFLPSEVWFGGQVDMDLQTQLDWAKQFVDAIDGLNAHYDPALADPALPSYDAKQGAFKDAVANLDKAIERVLIVRAQTGSISAQVDVARSTLESNGIQLESARARLLETDVAEASTKLVRAQTLLQAAQSIFSRLESSNLFARLG